MIRLAGVIAAACLALTPTAIAQATPPAGPVDLSLTTANAKYAMFFEKGSIKWTGRTVDLWILMVLPEASGATAAWYRETIDCTARTRLSSDIYPVDVSGVARAPLANTAKPMAALTPNSMDESNAQVLCDGKSFNFNRLAVGSVLAATAQGREFLKSVAVAN